MKHRAFLPLIFMTACLISTLAQASEDIAKKHGCLACHGIDKRLVGPAFKEIAGKYKSEKNAVTLLARHVRGGSKGVWGDAVMPPQAGISDDNLGKVVNWILAQ